MYGTDGNKGIRHVSLTWKWSSKVEHVAQQNLRAPGLPHDCKPLSASHCGYGSKGSTACCECTATLPTKRQQAVLWITSLTHVQWHSLRTDNFAYIIQFYIMANTLSHGIMNITWLWIDVPANRTKVTYRGRLGKPIVPIVVERRSLHMEEDPH